MLPIIFKLLLLNACLLLSIFSFEGTVDRGRREELKDVGFVLLGFAIVQSAMGLILEGGLVCEDEGRGVLDTDETLEARVCFAEDGELIRNSVLLVGFIFFVLEFQRAFGVFTLLFLLVSIRMG